MPKKSAAEFSYNPKTGLYRKKIKHLKPENKLEITCTRDELYAAEYNLCDTCLR